MSDARTKPDLCQGPTSESVRPRDAAIVPGAPAGIGLEIIVKACRALAALPTEGGELRQPVIGNGAALERPRTAFRIVGKGTASDRSPIEAVEYAEQLAPHKAAA